MAEETQLEMLNISDYFLLATSFNEDPTEENYAKLQDWINKIQVREYLPMKQKEEVMVGVLRFIIKDFDAPGAAAFLEIEKIEQALFAYCLNLKKDLTQLSNTYVAHDLYYEHGLVNYIVSKCGEDYKRLCTMIDNGIQFSNIYRLLESAQLMDNTEYDKWLETMGELKDTINSDNIKELMKFLASNDESGQELLSEIQEEALREVRADDEAEKAKFKKALETLDKNKEN